MRMRMAFFFHLLTAYSAMLFATGFASAQQEPATAASESGPQRSESLKLIPVRYLTATEAAKLVQQVIGQHARVMADERTNAILLISSEDRDFEVVEELLKVLDRSEPLAANGVRLRWFTVPLENNFESEEMVRLLKSLGEQLSGRNIVKSVIWGSDGGLILALGNDNECELLKRNIEELVEILEAKSAFEKQQRDAENAATAAPAVLRIVWLVSGLDESVTRLPSDNIQAAAAKLQALGVGELRQLTQILIRSGDDGVESQQSGMVKAPHPISFRVSAARTGASKWKLEIVTTDGSSDQFSTETRTEVSILPGQVVLLGVGPCGGHDSAFAVEVVPQEQ